MQKLLFQYVKIIVSLIEVGETGSAGRDFVPCRNAVSFACARAYIYFFYFFILLFRIGSSTR